MNDVILVVSDGSIKGFNHNQEKDAREYAKKNNGLLYWRDDWQDARKIVSQSFDTVESGASVVGIKIDKFG